MKNIKILILSCLSCFSVYSQQNIKPFEIQIDLSIPMELPKVSIFKKNGIPQYKQISVKLQKKLTQSIFLGLDLQYSENNLKQEFIENFKTIFNNGTTFIGFNDNSIYKGLLNIGYSKKYNKEIFEFAFSLGAGVQVNNISENRAIDPNYLSIYVLSEKSNSFNPLFQITLENIWYIKKNLGVNLGFKAQYLKFNKPQIFILNNPNPDNIESCGFCIIDNEEIISNRTKLFTIIPSLGVKYVFNN